MNSINQIPKSGPKFKRYFMFKIIFIFIFIFSGSNLFALSLEEDERRDEEYLYVGQIGNKVNHTLVPGEFNKYCHPSGFIVSFMRVKLKLGFLQPDNDEVWNLQVRTLDNKLIENIPSNRLKNGVWTKRINDFCLKIVIPKKEGVKVDIEEFLAEENSGELKGRFPIKLNGPKYNVDMVYSKPDLESNDSIDKAAVSVGLIQYMDTEEKQVSCSGFLISKVLMITNDHCFKKNTNLKNIEIYFKIIDKNDDTKHNFMGVEILLDDYALDFSILKLPEPVKFDFNYPSWRSDIPKSHEFFSIIQYPQGVGLRIAKDELCFIRAEKASNRGVNGNKDFAHRCDTDKGSSGGMIFSHTNDCHHVIGLHHWGIDKNETNMKLFKNQGVFIYEIYNKIKTLTKDKNPIKAKNASLILTSIDKNIERSKCTPELKES
jgi:hypothetical protein